MKNAKVTRPSFSEGDKEVVLTATVTCGSVSKVRDFKFLVKKDGVTDGQAVVIDLSKIKIPSETKTNIELPTEGVQGSVITWESTNKTVLTNDGFVTRPQASEQEVTVTLKATATKGSEKQEKEFKVKVLPWTVIEEINEAEKLINWDFIKGKNLNKTSINSDLVLPSTVGRGIKVTWLTTNDKYCTTSGKITQPTYTVGPIALTVTAQLSHKTEAVNVEIAGLVISTLEMTDSEILERTKQVLQGSLFLGDNESLVSITKDMKLPVRVNDTACSKASIVWTLADEGHNTISSNPFVSIKNNVNYYLAEIKQPTKEQGNASLAIKATITVSTTSGKPISGEKYFDITILAE